MFSIFLFFQQKRKSSDPQQQDEAETFTLLLLHLAFDLFKDTEVTDLLEDMKICCQKALDKKSKKNKADSDEQGKDDD
jgi:hypothetical protein